MATYYYGDQPGYGTSAEENAATSGQAMSQSNSTTAARSSNNPDDYAYLYNNSNSGNGSNADNSTADDIGNQGDNGGVVKGDAGGNGTGGSGGQPGGGEQANNGNDGNANGGENGNGGGDDLGASPGGNGDGDSTGGIDLGGIIGGGDGSGGSGGLGQILDPVTGIVDDATSGNLGGLDLGNLGLDNLGLDNLGLGNIGSTVGQTLGNVTSPVGNLVGAFVDQGNSILDTVGNTAGLSNTTDALTSVIDSLGADNIGTNGGGLIADVVNLPQDVLTGGDLGDSVANILNDGASTIGGELPSLAPSLLQDLGSPLISADFGSDGQSAGSHLIEADVGPQQDNGLILNALAQPDNGANHAVEANVGNGPNIIDANLLNGGDAIAIPALGNLGADSLTGLLDGSTGSGSSGASGSDSVISVADVADLGDITAANITDFGGDQPNNSSLVQGLI